jgi:hypothetical protein
MVMNGFEHMGVTALFGRLINLQRKNLSLASPLVTYLLLAQLASPYPTLHFRRHLNINPITKINHQHRQHQSCLNSTKLWVKQPKS